MLLDTNSFDMMSFDAISFAQIFDEKSFDMLLDTISFDMKPFDETPFDIMSSNKSHLARNIIEQKVIVPKDQLTYFLRGGCCRPPRDCR